MKNKMKGQQNIRRPLPIRIMALVMAVVMIFSVVYINNRKGVVKAATDREITDSSYIYSITHPGGGRIVDGNYTIYVPTGDDTNINKVTFSLQEEPVVDAIRDIYFTVSEGTGIGGENEYTIVSEAGENTYTLRESYSYSATWEVGSLTATSVTSTGDSEIDAVALLSPVFESSPSYAVYKNEAPMTEDEWTNFDPDKFNNKAEAYTSPLPEVKVTVKTQDVSDFSINNNTCAITDTDDANRTSPAEKTFYYGDVLYQVDSEDFANKTSTETALSNKDDGTYSVNKKIEVTIGETKQELFSTSTSVSYVKNSVLITDKSTTPAGTVDGDGNISLTGANPSQDITVSITTDVSLTTGITVTPGTVEGYDSPAASAVTYGTEGSKTHTFTIPANIANMGKTVKYTVNVDDTSVNGAENKKVEEFTVTASFDSGTPVFSDEKIGATARTDTKVLVKENQTISATVKTNGTSSSISKVDIYKTDSAGTIDDSTPKVAENLTPDANNVVSFTTTNSGESPTLTPGDNYYRMRATSSYGVSKDSEVFKIFYDDAAPKYLNPEINNKKGSGEWATYPNHCDGTVSDNSITFDEKVSSQMEVQIWVDPTDLQADGVSAGSGIADGGYGVFSFNGKTYNVRASGVKYSIIIPANDIKDTYKSGGDVDGTVTITDKAGRQTDYTIYFSFFDEDADIESYDIVSTNTTTSKGNYIEQNPLLGQYGIIWEEAELTAEAGSFDIIYTIDSDADLASVTLSDGDDSHDQTISGAGLTRDTDTGKYNLRFTKTYDSLGKDSSPDSESYSLTLTITNANDVKTTHVIDLVEVDLKKPSMTVGVDDTQTVINAKKVGDWYKHLVLLVTPTDDMSGIATVTGVGITEPTVIIDGGVGGAVVSESTEDTGTPVTITVSDKAGHSYSVGPTNYKVDSQAPEASIKVNGNSVSGDVYIKGDTAPTLKFEATEVGASGLNATLTKVFIGDDEDDASKSIAWSADGTISFDQILTIEGDTEPVENKKYEINFVAYDNAGNRTLVTANIYFDKTMPDATIKVKGNSPKTSGFYNGSNVEVEFTVTDKFVDSIWINGEPSPISSWTQSGDTLTKTITINSDGAYNYSLKVADKSGQEKSATPVSFTYDNTKPSVTTLLNGSEYTKLESYNKTVTTGISYTDANKDDNDITATIIRKIPGGGEEKITKKGVGPFTLSADGIYSVIYDVKDKAGNLTTTDEIKFTVDNTAPVHNLYVTTANPSKVEDYPNNYINGVGKWQSSHEAYRYGQFYNGDVTVELNYFDYNLDWVYVTDNGEEISPSWTKNGAFGKATYTFTSEGYHDVQIWSKDFSGNETNDTVLGKRVRFTIDRSAPSITTYLNSSLYSEGSGTRYLNTNGSLNVSVSEGNKDTYDLTRSYKVTPPGGTSKTYEDKVDEGTENYSEEADYEVSYVAVDKAGNKSATRNVYFRVDRTAPKLTINGPGSSSNASSTSVSFNVQESFYWDMTSCTVKIYKKVDGSGEVLEKTLDMNPSSANYSQSYSFVDDAEYRMEFTAEDKCGNKSQTDYTFIKDGNAPSILLSGVKNYDKTDKNVELTITIEEAFYTSNRVTLSGTRTDIDGKSHKIDFDDFATNRTKISQLQQMFKEDGIYDITVTSTDKAGNSSSKTVHFTIDTTKPVIGDLSKYDGVRLNKFKWDVDLDELVKDLTVCDIKLYLDGALYDGTSDIEDGSHVLKVEATDELGHSSSKEVTFVLDSKAPNIIVMNVEEGDNLLESTDITVTVELDEDSLDTVTLNDKAIDIANNEGKITVNTKGDYVLNATAHDEAGNVSSVEIKFSYGKQTNLLFIGIIAGAAILLLLLLLVFLRRRRNDN